MILGLGIQFAEAWTNPGATPPGGNISGPITTGIGSQTKAGGDISLGGAGSLYAGNLIAAPQLCIGSDCRSAWPAGGISSISGGSCAAGQVVKSISSTGVATCGADTDPTVSASVKDGVSWSEVTGKPASFPGGFVKVIYNSNPSSCGSAYAPECGAGLTGVSVSAGFPSEVNTGSACLCFSK